MRRAFEAIIGISIAALAGALLVSGLWALLAFIAGLVSFLRVI